MWSGTLVSPRVQTLRIFTERKEDKKSPLKSSCISIMVSPVRQKHDKSENNVDRR